MPLARILAFAVLPAALSVSALRAQPEQSASVGDTQAPAEAVQPIQRRLAEARTNLALAEAVSDTAMTNAPGRISLQDVATRRALLSRLVRLLEQQLSNTAELETTKSRRAELDRKAQAWTRFAESPPYSILLPDRIREELQTEQLRSASGEAAVSTIDQLISDNRSELTHTEERIRSRWMSCCGNATENSGV